MERRQSDNEGLNLAPESGLEVIHGPVLLPTGPSNLPEVSQGPTWQQQADTTGSYTPPNPFFASQYEQTPPPFNRHQGTSPSSGYAVSTSDASPIPAYKSPATESPSGRVAGQKRERIWGMKIKTFFIVLAVVILVVVIGIAVGLGVGLALRHHSDSGSDDDTPTTANATIRCPDADEIVYRADGTERYFQIYCGIDYNESDGASELENLEEKSMASCIDECASHDDCIAAGYGNYNDVMRCFMKKGIGKSNASSSWIFTKEVDKPS